ncbi:hypothetical protein QF043_003139 [Pseudomonas sp. W3I7]|uniref:hypothetical protein n=1 Tax=Pseudomonas sp. W3I7 TaxID=3042292 RepID=UPI00278DFB90|nr:hypothetical protein [Pseudomonas sp. W3I7]MDQ0704347.1 hypothetical protein [Pseudomonas sp. W3I7]
MNRPEPANRNTSPIKPRARNRLGITALLPRRVFALIIALCTLGALQDRVRRVLPVYAVLLCVGMLMLLWAG